MKCILLCAGYATRLYPLTKDYPKALLEIEEGKPLLNYILEEVNTIDEVDQIYVISNNKYYKQLNSWRLNTKSKKPINIINDSTNSNEDRLGAIGDIMYTIQYANIDDDLLIIAGDTLFDYKLKDFVNYYKKVKAPIVAGKVFDDVELLKRCGVIKIDKKNKIVGMVEKPLNPDSNIVAFATYLYPKNIIPIIEKYLHRGNKPDAPGYLIEYLYKKMPIYSFIFNGNCYDIGTHEALSYVRNLYREVSVIKN